MLGTRQNLYATERADEYTIKAAYVYNLAKFVRFGENKPLPPTAIVIVGVNPFSHLLSQNKKLQFNGGPPLKVLVVDEAGDVPDYSLVFVSNSEKRKLNRLLQQWKNRPILTLSDADDFLRKGGMVRLLVIDGRVEMEVNLAALQSGKATLPYQVLELASRVVNR